MQCNSSVDEVLSEDEYLLNTPNKHSRVTKSNLRSELFTKAPIVLLSRSISDVLPMEQLLGIRTELKILLLSAFDSLQGIPVQANQPLGCKEPVINLTRPAVLRVYFAVSKRSTKSLNIIRPTYGPISTASSVGMDPHNFTTKAMSLNLYNISEYLRKKMMEINCSEQPFPLTEEFNHCTVLIYSGSNNNGCSNSLLSFHSDCTFDHNGNYIPYRNSQKKNSSVLVLTVGDCRTLYFKKRIVIESTTGRKRWKITDDTAVSFRLENNSVFLLHPQDEIPILREGDDLMSQYVHGGVKINNENDLSIAFVFRVVSVDREYDPITCKLIPEKRDMRIVDDENCFHNQQLREALHNFRLNQLEIYSKHFKTFVKNKFAEWNW